MLKELSVIRSFNDSYKVLMTQITKCFQQKRKVSTSLSWEKPDYLLKEKFVQQILNSPFPLYWKINHSKILLILIPKKKNLLKLTKKNLSLLLKKLNLVQHHERLITICIDEFETQTIKQFKVLISKLEQLRSLGEEIRNDRFMKERKQYIKHVVTKELS